MEPTEQTEDRKLSAAEALSEILETVQRIDENVQALIDFVNEAGEQINAMAGKGLGQLLGGMLNGDGDLDLDELADAVEDGDSGDDSD